AATNHDLASLVREGRFREDLYYRLNVVQIRVPSLRERKQDIPLLANAFLKEISERDGKAFRPLSPDAMECLLQYDWPGNVRELKGAIDSGMTLSTGQQIAPRDLPPAVRGKAESPVLREAGSQDHVNLQENERRLIIRALEECDGNRTEAAKKLGISRRTLHRRIRELQLPD